MLSLLVQLKGLQALRLHHEALKLGSEKNFCSAAFWQVRLGSAKVQLMLHFMRVNRLIITFFFSNEKRRRCEIKFRQAESSGSGRVRVWLFPIGTFMQPVV